MKGRGKSVNKEKIFSVIISFAVIFALGYGIYSVVNTAGKSQKNENNIVNLDETENENVAIRTEDANMPDTQPDDAENSDAEIANADVVNKNSTQQEQMTEPEQQTEQEETTEAQPEQTVDVAAQVKSDPLADYTFNESSTLSWPVNGDIILKYSMDSTIYFKTLGVYKCNPAISIAAAVGTNVGVAADGIVQSVEKSEETGTTVSIAIGDGYMATYGLLDGVVVKKGDKVTAGQLLGTVAEPTAYYTQEGSNVYFKLTKDDVPVDPTPLFEE